MIPRTRDCTYFDLWKEGSMTKTHLRTVGVIALGTLLLVGCSTLSFFQPDDKAITVEVQAKLFQDSTLRTRDIRIATEKGVVVLSGGVATDLEKAAAERLVSQVSGVKQVINQLSILGSSGNVSSTPEVAAQPEQVPGSPSAGPGRAGKPSRATRRSEPASAPTVSGRAKPVETAAAQPSAPLAATAAASAPAPRPPERITIPAGTRVTVRMIDSIDSARNRAGEEFAASVDNPVVVGSRVAIPQGADAKIRLVEARSAGHMTGSSELQLELISVAVNGTPYNVTSGYYEAHGASRGKRTAETVGGGAGLGALIGAIAGRGKGAAIGAAAGAGAGTAVEAATRGQQVRVASETRLDFTLKTPVTVTP